MSPALSIFASSWSHLGSTLRTRKLTTINCSSPVDAVTRTRRRLLSSVRLATIVGCLPKRLPTINGRNSSHSCKNTLVPMRGKKDSVDVSLRQFTGFCAPVPSGVNFPTILASGTVSSSAAHAGKRTVFGPICSTSSPKTQTWQRSCPTALLYAPICAQQAGQKKGTPARTVPRSEPVRIQQQDPSPR